MSLRSAGARAAAVGAAFAALAGSAAHAAPVGETLLPTLAADGQVEKILPVGDSVYVAGNFGRIGRASGNGIALDAATMDAADLPKIGAGTVVAVEPDGSGGWYVGGDFSSVGGLPRRNLVHITAAGAVDPAFHPDPDGTVSAIAVLGDTVYVGGDFATFGGASRARLAAIGSDGSARGWNPGADDEVFTLAAVGTTVYAGGTFGTLGGSARANVGALDATTGAATAWAPQADDRVLSLEAAGGSVYAAGWFTTIGGQSRTFLAELEGGDTGDATSWNPGVDGGSSVIDVAVTSDTVWFVGNFNTVGGQSRNWSAAVDRATGARKDWAPALNGTAEAIAVSGSKVFVGGGFEEVAGQPHDAFVTLDAATGAPTGPSPGTAGLVLDVAVSGGRVYAGGSLQMVDGVARRYLAELDAATGELTDWAPDPDNVVYALAASGSRLYVGGWFDQIAGQPRGRGAAFDLADGALTGWNPQANSLVTQLLVHGDTVFATGAFSQAGGAPRAALAALSAESGAATSWNASPAGGDVEALALQGTTLYLAGSFHTMGGEARSRLAAVDADTAALLPWNPVASGPVRTMAAAGNTIYVAGNFSTIGGVPRQRAAGLSASSGQPTAFDPRPTDSVQEITPFDGIVLLGGFFTEVADEERDGLAAVDSQTGSLLPFDASMPESIVNTMVAGTDRLWVGGYFSDVGGEAQYNLASFAIAPASLEPPSLTGTAAPGQELACGEGRWRGTRPLTSTRRWLRDGEPVAGATGERYTVTAADATRTIACEVTAANGLGSATATSTGLRVADAAGLTAGTNAAPGPAAPGATAPPSSPRRRPALAFVGRPRVRGDRVTVRLRCAAGGPACAGKVSAHARVRRARGRRRSAPRRFLVAKRAYALAPGQARTVVMRLNRTGRGLRRHRRLSALVSVTLNRPEGGHDVVSRARVRIRRAR